LEPIIAYPPIIPRGVIKMDPLEEKDCEEQVQQVIAYPPIPRRWIKEESIDNRDDFNLEEHQVQLNLCKISTVAYSLLF